MFVLEMDDFADKDFSHYITESECFRCKQNWWISLKKSENIGPLRNRSDINKDIDHVRHVMHEIHDPSSNDRGPLKKTFLDASLFQIVGFVIFFFVVFISSSEGDYHMLFYL